MEKERLDKWIAGGGQYSRKEARELVRRGLVLVGGKPALGPEQKVAPGERITIAGQEMALQKHIYLMLNKPAGVLSATRDKHCQTVLDLVPPELRRRGLFPAGRLDKDAEGFVLLTDDGEFAHRILSPKRHVPKMYFVQIVGELDLVFVQKEFALGVELGEGEKTSPAEMKILKNGSPAEVELVICEGMYHQVKRMFARYGGTVTYLRRIKIGNLPLDPELPPGGCRVILHKELEII